MTTYAKLNPIPGGGKYSTLLSLDSFTILPLLQQHDLQSMIALSTTKVSCSLLFLPPIVELSLRLLLLFC